METIKSKRWLERLIALILVSAVVLAFYGRAQRIFVVVERESVQQFLSSVRLGIQIFVLTDIARGRVADMRAYNHTNPMRLQDQEKLPVNYAGELDVEAATGVSGGQWYYDKSVGQLVYRVMHYPLFENDDRRELRYSLQFSNIAGDAFSLHLIEVKAGT